MNSDELLEKINVYCDLLKNETVFVVRDYLYSIIKCLTDLFLKSFQEEIENERFDR